MKFKVIYPKKWDDQFKCDTDEKTAEIIKMSMTEWCEGLAGMSGDQVKKAITYCRTNLEWPPSIAEFVKAGKIDRPVHDMLLPRPPKVKPSPENIKRVRDMIAGAFNEIE